MPISIKNPKTERLARSLAKRTGETITEAVTVALRERMNRQQPRAKAFREKIQEIQKRVAALPVLDDRTPDEILGFDENGTFGS